LRTETPTRAWIVRPIVWFATGSIATTILHEVAHACTAYALGVRSTLFNYWANIQYTPVQADGHLLPLIRVAGPLVCLLAGTASWLAYKRARGSALELPLLYLSVFGIATFFGNLMSTAFVGDFSGAAAELGLTMSVRYTIAVIGAFCLAAVHAWAGRELIRLVPAHVGRGAGILGLVAAPVVLGTAAVILVNQPMAGTFAITRVAEAGFWLFAAIGALLAERHSGTPRGSLALRWSDGAAALLAGLVVRLMVPGIPFVP
jgi:hypothetical protein